VRRARLAKTIIFETRFSRKLFEENFKQNRPNVIIGLGQAHRARKIRIERRAINQRSSGKKPDKLICHSGPAYRYVNLILPVSEMSTISYDAGRYVCNFSMYIACEYAVKTGAYFAFLHFPIGTSPKAGVSYLREILRDI
jgi:pyrrolidone-carboxylate peptidase